MMLTSMHLHKLKSLRINCHVLTKISVANFGRLRPTFKPRVDAKSNSKIGSIGSSTSFQSAVNGFDVLGLAPGLIEALKSQNIKDPTGVQKAVIPKLLNKENIVMAASTGSGKTLAYVLPTIQSLAQQEKDGYVRKMKRPRCLVLVPTRDLARQVLNEVKQVSHFCKVSSTAVLGGEEYGKQRRSLENFVDIVVASPGRLMQHKEQQNVKFDEVDTIIIDEVDTMLTQGFGADIRAILNSTMVKPSASGLIPKPSVHLVMATATLTKAVKLLLSDVQGFNIKYTDPGAPPSSSEVHLKQVAERAAEKAATAQEFERMAALNGLGNVTSGANSAVTPTEPAVSSAPVAVYDSNDKNRIKMNIVEVDGLHRSLPNVRHIVEETKGIDKLMVLNRVLNQYVGQKDVRTMIFCNTIASARAVEYAINDGIGATSFEPDSKSNGEVRAVSYHGDLNSREREINLERFRQGTEQYLVCTDIAARGLDIPAVNHVIMFDFPLNPIDYLHRAGRCGRAGRKGQVTSIVTKRDVTLSMAIQKAIEEGLPLDSLSSTKADYKPKQHKMAINNTGASEKDNLTVKMRPSELSASTNVDTKGTQFINENSSRVATFGNKSVPLNRPVNELGLKLSRKRSVRPGHKPMFPDSTRQLSPQLRKERELKIKHKEEYSEEKAVAGMKKTSSAAFRTPDKKRSPTLRDGAPKKNKTHTDKTPSSRDPEPDPQPLRNPKREPVPGRLRKTSGVKSSNKKAKATRHNTVATKKSNKSEPKRKGNKIVYKKK